MWCQDPKYSIVPVDSNFTPEVDEPMMQDVDEEISQQMTASYSEISFKSELSPENENEPSLSLTLDHIPLEPITQRPATLASGHSEHTSQPLGPLNLEGTVHIEGNMTYFVAEDLEYKIKLSSPVAKKGGMFIVHLIKAKIL